jgi:hypothetical protein
VKKKLKTTKMKLILLLLLPLTIFTQLDSTNIKIDKSDVHVRVSNMPTYEICENLSYDELILCTQREIQKFVVQNYSHPDVAKEHGIQGKMFFQFTINKYGYIQDILVLRSAHKILELPCIEAIKKVPRLIPGKDNSKPVNVYHTLILNITYEDEKTKKELKKEERESKKKAKKNE